MVKRKMTIRVMDSKNNIALQSLFLVLIHVSFIGALYWAYRAGTLLKSEYALFIMANGMHSMLYEYKILRLVNITVSLVLLILTFFLVKG
jgi:hypothetical protein